MHGDDRHREQDHSGLDALTRHERIARAFPASLAEQFGRDAPAALRTMADDLERILGAAADSMLTPGSSHSRGADG